MRILFMPAASWAAWPLTVGALLAASSSRPWGQGMSMLHEPGRTRLDGEAGQAVFAERAAVDFDALVVRLSFIDAMASRAVQPVERAREYWCRAQAIVDAVQGLAAAQVESLASRYVDGLCEGVCGIALADSLACAAPAGDTGVPAVVLMAVGAIGRRHGALVRALCPAEDEAGQDGHRPVLVS